MEAYAVVETGGKQYRVKEKDVLTVERLDVEAGNTVELTPVLAVSDGQKLAVGTPVIAGAKVVSTVLDHPLGEKLVSFKKRRRKGYARKMGHRQQATRLRVEKIVAG
jgi:large subunit ribosomal protein L21